MKDGVLEMSGLSKHFNGVEALSGFTCSIQKGTIVGIIGPNGAGKTTVFDIITGYVAADSGRVRFKGAEILGRPPHEIAAAGIARTFQNLRLAGRMSVLDNVMLWLSRERGVKLGDALFRQRRTRETEAENRNVAYGLLRDAALDPLADAPAAELSYGQQKLLTVVCCLAAAPDVCLLDEPVAGLSPEVTAAVMSLVREVPSRGRSVLVIEHNIDVVMQICDWVVFMDAGSKICEGTPVDVRNDARIIEAYLD